MKFRVLANQRSISQLWKIIFISSNWHHSFQKIKVNYDKPTKWNILSSLSEILTLKSQLCTCQDSNNNLYRKLAMYYALNIHSVSDQSTHWENRLMDSKKSVQLQTPVTRLTNKRDIRHSVLLNFRVQWYILSSNFSNSYCWYINLTVKS